MVAIIVANSDLSYRADSNCLSGAGYVTNPMSEADGQARTAVGHAFEVAARSPRPSTTKADPGAPTPDAVVDGTVPASARRLRLLGGLGALLMAVSSYGAGATPWTEPDKPPFQNGLQYVPWWYAAGVALWLLGAAVICRAWWLLGRLVRRDELAATVPEGWMVRTALLWAVPFLLAMPVGSRDVYAYALQGLLYVEGFNPYVVGPAVLNSEWLEQMSPIWRHSTSPYGPVAILVSAFAAAASAGELAGALGWLRLTAFAGVILVAVFVPRLARACGVEPAVAAWLGLAGPVLLVHGLAGAHHDLLTVGLMLAGLDCAVRRRGWLAGIALGLAAAVKVTAFIALPFAAVLVAANLAGTRKLTRGGAVLAVSAGGAFLVTTVVSGLGVGWIDGAPGTNSIIHWLSVPTSVGLVVGESLRLVGVPDGLRLAVVSLRLFAWYILLPITVLVLWWRIRHSTDTRRVVEYTGWALVAAVLLSPLVYPWYFIAPITLLAVATTNDRVRWVLASVGILGVLVTLPDGYNLARATMWPGAYIEVVGLAAALIRYRYLRRRRAETDSWPGTP
jgi:hypothetical protein